MTRIVFVLTLAIAVLPLGAGVAGAAPGNDAFAAADALALPGTVTTDTAGATTEPGEPSPSCSAASSTVWYTATPSADTTIDLSTFGSKFDTVLAVYTGPGLGALTEAACNDDVTETGSLQSKLTLVAAAGETLYIQVGGYQGASGALELSAAVAVLDNDLFAYAEPIASIPFTTEQSNADATTETGEPSSPCGPMSGTLWFRYTPAADHVLRVDTVGSDFDTVLTAYTGATLDTLDVATCNDDMPSSLESQITLPVLTGETYYLQAGGLVGSTGSMVLHAFELVTPANDEPQGAHPLTNPDSHTTDTGDATTHPSEPDPCEVLVGSTVWYSFTAAQNEPVLIDTYLSDFDTVLAVYTGTGYDDLELVGCMDDTNGYTSDVGFIAQEGETYLIQVGGYFGETGEAVVRARTGASIGEASVGTDFSEADVCALGLCINLPLL